MPRNFWESPRKGGGQGGARFYGVHSRRPHRVDTVFRDLARLKTLRIRIKGYDPVVVYRAANVVSAERYGDFSVFRHYHIHTWIFARSRKLLTAGIIKRLPSEVVFVGEKWKGR